MTPSNTTTVGVTGSRKNVLVIDDSKTMRNLLIKTISGYSDFVVHEAEDGLMALDVIKKTPIHLIFVDYNMPRMNGIEFMKSLRAQPAYKTVPIVMLTTESEEGKVRQGYVSGATVYVTKPYKPEALIKVVDALRYWHVK